MAVIVHCARDADWLPMQLPRDSCSINRRPTGPKSMPFEITMTGTEEEVAHAWEDYARGVVGYGISIYVVGTLFVLAVAIASCMACGKAACFNSQAASKPSAMRLVSIWSFGILTVLAGVIAVVTPGAVKNMDKAYVDGLDVAINFLEITVRLGTYVDGIGTGLTDIQQGG